MARWLIRGGECPLYSTDLYFAGHGFEKEVITFKDDEPTEATRVIVEMLRYMADKTGLEIKGKINNIEI